MRNFQGITFIETGYRIYIQICISLPLNMLIKNKYLLENLKKINKLKKEITRKTCKDQLLSDNTR